MGWWAQTAGGELDPGSFGSGQAGSPSNHDPRLAPLLPSSLALSVRIHHGQPRRCVHWLACVFWQLEAPSGGLTRSNTRSFAAAVAASIRPAYVSRLATCVPSFPRPALCTSQSPSSCCRSRSVTSSPSSSRLARRTAASWRMVRAASLTLATDEGSRKLQTGFRADDLPDATWEQDPAGPLGEGLPPSRGRLGGCGSSCRRRHQPGARQAAMDGSGASPSSSRLDRELMRTPTDPNP